MRAGARETIYFNPSEVNVAIVTCGGLCPGLNDVVQGLVNKLSDYGVPDGHILGIKCASNACTLMLPPCCRACSSTPFSCNAPCMHCSTATPVEQPVHGNILVPCHLQVWLQGFL